MDKNFLQDILKKLKKRGAEEADVVFSSSKNKKSYKSIFDFSVYVGAIITTVIFLQNYL